MSADSWEEDARGLWQSQESVVTRMTADEMRARAERWNRAFGRTNWIALAGAGFFLAFFGWMMVVHQAALQRVGALVGIAAAIYLAAAGSRVASARWVEDGATCARAYRMQLQRRSEADRASARTILLAMTGCALLSGPGDWFTWTLQAGGQLAAGVVAYVYITRQARRFEARIDELRRLEGDAETR
jgi:hypothetical protein